MLSVKANRTQSANGVCRLNFGKPLAFKKWKVFLNKQTGIVLVEFLFTDVVYGRYVTPWTINPLSVKLRDEITFENTKEWKVFEEECDTAFKSQMKKFPGKHKQQIEDSLNDLKFFKERFELTNKSEIQIEFIYSIINNN
jgi:hypothetical protein